jgi:prophage regulatory protein
MTKLFLSRGQMLEASGLSWRTARRLIAAGEFPQRRQISAGRVGWLVSEIDKWAQSRPIGSTIPTVQEKAAAKRLRMAAAMETHA